MSVAETTAPEGVANSAYQWKSRTLQVAERQRKEKLAILQSLPKPVGSGGLGRYTELTADEFQALGEYAKLMRRYASPTSVAVDSFFVVAETLMDCYGEFMLPTRSESVVNPVNPNDRVLVDYYAPEGKAHLQVCTAFRGHHRLGSWTRKLRDGQAQQCIRTELMHRFGRRNAA